VNEPPFGLSAPGVQHRDGGLLLPGILDDFFRDACRRAGYEPQFRKTMFGGQGGWEVSPY
jgi:hypothetical protein